MPSGWTLVSLQNGAANGQIQGIFDKVAGTAEPASYTWTASTPVFAAGGIAAYGNVNTASPIDVDKEFLLLDTRSPLSRLRQLPPSTSTNS